MKKLFVGILVGLMCFVAAFCMTGCNIAEYLDLASENEQLIKENESLKEEINSLEAEIVEFIEMVEGLDATLNALEVENATLKFEAAFKDRIVGGDNVVELSKVAIQVGDKAGDAVTVVENAHVTINGGSYDGGQTPFGGAGNTAVWVNGVDATVIINDGKFTINGLAIDEEGNKDVGHIDLIYCSAGTIEINGGWFEGADSDVWLLNCKDSAYREGTASIVVKGGTFVNWNPANCVSEGEATNFVAEGYIVVEEIQENGDVWYRVEEAPVEPEVPDTDTDETPEEEIPGDDVPDVIIPEDDIIEEEPSEEEDPTEDESTEEEIEDTEE